MERRTPWLFPGNHPRPPHHPHLHCVVPGGQLSIDSTRWVACRPGFFLPVRVLSRHFCRLFWTYLQDAFDAGIIRRINAALLFSSWAANSPGLPRILFPSTVLHHSSSLVDRHPRFNSHRRAYGQRFSPIHFLARRRGASLPGVLSPRRRAKNALHLRRTLYYALSGER